MVWRGAHRAAQRPPPCMDVATCKGRCRCTVLRTVRFSRKRKLGQCSTTQFARRQSPPRRHLRCHRLCNTKYTEMQIAVKRSVGKGCYLPSESRSKDCCLTRGQDLSFDIRVVPDARKRQRLADFAPEEIRLLQSRFLSPFVEFLRRSDGAAVRKHRLERAASQRVGCQPCP